jgi:hypothetical protein
VEREAARFNVVDCGRRWGKTKYGVRKACETMLTGGRVGWFAPTYKVLDDAWGEIKDRLGDVTTRKDETDHILEVMTGGIFEAWSLDKTEDAGRSRHYHRVVIDEAAMVPNLAGVWQKAIRPTLADYRGDAFFFSTPRGRNFFWEIWQRGQDPARADWVSWQFPTASNPYIHPGEIEAARQELPERLFKQEWLAEFLDDPGGVYRGVRACATEQRREPYAGRFVMGVDWGQANDFTVLVVMDSETRKVVDLDRFNQIGWSMQRGRLKALADRWSVGAIIAESNSMGGPNVEALQDEGLPVTAFETTGVSKPPLIESLALAFERQEIAILDDPVLVGELEAYERDVSPVTGRSRYSAPEGMHDDCVMALALAWWGITNGRVSYGPALWN